MKNWKCENRGWCKLITNSNNGVCRSRQMQCQCNGIALLCFAFMLLLVVFFVCIVLQNALFQPLKCDDLIKWYVHMQKPKISCESFSKPIHMVGTMKQNRSIVNWHVVYATRHCIPQSFTIIFHHPPHSI